MKIILASNSPRRISILNGWGFDVKIKQVDYKEKIFPLDPIKTVIHNAYGKAYSVRDKNDVYPIVGVDTVVELDGKILGKPENQKENKAMLEMLSEKKHNVYSGVAVILKDIFVVDFVKTVVLFRKILDKEIDVYVKSAEGIDKAGGYAVQGIASSFIEGIKGPVDNVMGLPVYALRNALDKISKNI